VLRISIFGSRECSSGKMWLSGFRNHGQANADELCRFKREFLQTEVTLAKARATTVGAEVDIMVLCARVRALI